MWPQSNVEKRRSVEMSSDRKTRWNMPEAAHYSELILAHSPSVASRVSHNCTADRVRLRNFRFCRRDPRIKFTNSIDSAPALLSGVIGSCWVRWRGGLRTEEFRVAIAFCPESEACSPKLKRLRSRAAPPIVEYAAGSRAEISAA
jgi:hypothetical protein